MIPLSNREKLIKLLDQGVDIRTACKEASITRSNLYKYFKEMPGFRNDVDEAIKRYQDVTKEREKKEIANGMEKIRQIVMKNRLKR